LHPFFWAADLELVATVADVHRQALFEVFEVLIYRSAERGKTAGIVRFEHDTACYGNDC
jgi:hypothetical protein